MDDEDEMNNRLKIFFSKRGLFVTISAVIIILLVPTYTYSALFHEN